MSESRFIKNLRNLVNMPGLVQWYKVTYQQENSSCAIVAEAFRFLNEDAVESAMPQAGYKSAKFSSLKRQINSYGFQNVPTKLISKEIAAACCYFHPNGFDRTGYTDRKVLAKTKTTKQLKSSKAIVQSAIPFHSTYSGDSFKEEQVPLMTTCPASLELPDFIGRESDAATMIQSSIFQLSPELKKPARKRPKKRNIEQEEHHSNQNNLQPVIPDEPTPTASHPNNLIIDNDGRRVKGPRSFHTSDIFSPEVNSWAFRTSYSSGLKTKEVSASAALGDPVDDVQSNRDNELMTGYFSDFCPANFGDSNNSNSVNQEEEGTDISNKSFIDSLGYFLGEN